MNETPSAEWCSKCGITPDICGLKYQCAKLERMGKIPEPPTFKEENVSFVPEQCDLPIV